jgi:hypothetical protein
MRALRHLGFALWLALALVVGQQAAALHALGHATERLSQKPDKNAPTPSCSQCPLFSPLSGAAPSGSLPSLALAGDFPCFTATQAAAPRPAPAVPFHSRAPPFRLA